MDSRRSKLAKVLRGTGIVIGVLAGLLYIGLPAAMGIAAVLPAKAGTGSLPAGFKDVTLHTADGIQLAGWYHPPVNGAVILLLHGAGGSRESMRPHAEMLVKHGYGVLAFDLRGHGQSQGKTNRLGWQGTPDVGAAVAFLKEQEGIERIGGVGSSMGGEVLLGAAAEYPEIQAIVADGATRRSTVEYLALEANRPLVRNFTSRVMYATVRLLTGEQPPSPLFDSMVQSKSTRFLLIAAGQNKLETEFNQLFAKTLGSRASLWIVPGATHTGAFSLNPATYEQRVTEFFQAELLTGNR